MAKALKKKTVSKKVKRKKKTAHKAPKRVTVFVAVSASSKKWLVDRCKSKPGVVSKATMIESILQGLKNKPEICKQLGV